MKCSKFPGRWLRWLWTSENTVNQHQQMTWQPKSSLTVETSHWTSRNMDAVHPLFLQTLGPWFPNEMLKACGHPCCLCIFSYPISSFQSTLHVICFDTALLEQPPLSVITLCDLPSLWKVSMFVIWTIAKSAVFPIIVVSKNKRYLKFILYRLGMARYHFFRTDTDPIPKILSICRYRSNTSTVFF